MSNASNVSDGLDKVKQLWSLKSQASDIEGRKYVSWMVHPYVERNYINQKISGDPDQNWLIHVKNRYFAKQVEFGLTLGCGDGCLERHAISLGICERFDAFDVADGAIDTARSEAVKAGIESYVNYDVRDINVIQLEAEKYDVVFASSSAHHFVELEHIFEQVRHALKPSGYFFLCEFVGPNQFQWTDKQLQICNDLLSILPERYRRIIPDSNRLKERIERPSVEWMNNYDPSEAIRSAEIDPLLPRYFNVLARVDFGGTLLHLLLSDIAGNFDTEIDEDMAMLKMLCYLEETLITEKVISSDFAFLIAQKP